MNCIFFLGALKEPSQFVFIVSFLLNLIKMRTTLMPSLCDRSDTQYAASIRSNWMGVTGITGGQPALPRTSSSFGDRRPGEIM